MGKGDKKSRRGKITIGSFGVRRPKKKIQTHSIKTDGPIKVAKAKPLPKEKKEVKEVKEVKTHKEVKVKKEITEETKAKVAVKKKQVE